MPIPNYTLDREWVDGSDFNPDLVNLYRPCLVAFVAFNKDHVPSIVGTGFIIGQIEEFCVVITAKHVVTGAASIQRPTPRHSPSAIFIPNSATQPSIAEDSLRAFWTDSNGGDLLFTRHIGYNENFDIACALFEVQPEYRSSFKPSSVLLDANEPKIGDVVHMVSSDKLEILDYSSPTDISGAGFKFSMNRRVSVRIGTVTGVYPKGYRQYKWPCFTTSIPAEPGMSGGMVFIPKDKEPISVCGIVSADASSEEARVNEKLSGESIIASAWTGLSLPFPEMLSSNPPMTSIYELMKKNYWPQAIGFENIKFVDVGDENGTISNNKSMSF